MRINLKTKFTLAFALIALTPTIFVLFFGYNLIKEIVLNPGKNRPASLSGLEVIGKYKKAEIVNFFNELKGHSLIIGSSAITQELFSRLNANLNDLHGPAYLEAKAQTDKEYKSLNRNSPLGHNLLLINPEGTIVYSTNDDRAGQKLKTEANELFQKSKNGFAQTNFYDETNKKIVLLLATPIVNISDAYLGTAMIEYDLDNIFVHFIDYTGLGETGEVMLLKKVNNQILFLNQLRHDPAAMLTKKITIGSKLGTGAQQAIAKEFGVGDIIDYRGVNCVALWDYIPEFDWGIVVKIDRTEMYSELNRAAKALAIVLPIIILLTLLISYLNSRAITKPIVKLTKMTDDISRGKLDAKLDEINTNDEIGDLARAFERVMVSLKLAMLEHTKKNEKK